MKIRIIDKKDGGVFFVSSFGSGFAQWWGSDLESSSCHDVEMDFDKKYTWMKDVFLSDQQEEMMAFSGGRDRVVSRIIDADHDVVAMKLGGDVFFLEVAGFDFSAIGSLVEFESRIDETKITPFFL